MATYHLHKWSVTTTEDPFLAPEVATIRLRGYRDDEQKAVVTSRVVDINGKNITTYSGSVYILEDVDPDYLQWLNDRGYDFDPENPIKDKRNS